MQKGPPSFLPPFYLLFGAGKHAKAQGKRGNFEKAAPLLQGKPTNLGGRAPLRGGSATKWREDEWIATRLRGAFRGFALYWHQMEPAKQQLAYFLMRKGEMMPRKQSPKGGSPSNRQESQQEATGKPPADAGKSPPKGGKTRGSRRAPASPLDISVLARKRVRKMIKILDEIAANKQGPAAARVSAAKELLNLAKMNPDDLRGLPDKELYAVVRAMAKMEGKKFEKELLAEVKKQEAGEQGAPSTSSLSPAPSGRPSQDFAGREWTKEEVEVLEKREIN